MLLFSAAKVSIFNEIKKGKVKKNKCELFFLVI